MPCFPYLLLGALLCLNHVHARSCAPCAAERATAQPAPARMVQALYGMSAMLDSVTSKAAADAAAPELLKQFRLFRRLQAAADALPPMGHIAQERHLAQMDQAMNAFRLACARLVRERFYGSTPLGNAVSSVAQSF